MCSCLLFSLDPIYEEVPKGLEDGGEENFYDNDISHYDRPPNPYNTVSPRYSTPRDLRDGVQQEVNDEEETYVAVSTDPSYVAMNGAMNGGGGGNDGISSRRDVNLDQQNNCEDPSYVAMNRNRNHSSSSFKENNSSSNPTVLEEEGYEDMSPSKYKDIINNDDNYVTMKGVRGDVTSTNSTTTGNELDAEANSDDDDDKSGCPDYLDLTEEDPPPKINSSTSSKGVFTRNKLPPPPPAATETNHGSASSSTEAIEKTSLERTHTSPPVPQPRFVRLLI